MSISQSPERRSLLIIGLGNELLADDGVGIWVVRDLKRELSTAGIAFEELSVGGLQLLDYLVGWESCIIVDAVMTYAQPPGTLYRFVQEASEEPVRLLSSHQVDLPQVIGLAKLMKADIPRTITVYGIEAGDVTTFGGRCTEPVMKAIPQLVELICRDLLENRSPRQKKSIPAAVSTSSHLVGNWEIIPLNLPGSLEHEVSDLAWSNIADTKRSS